MKYSKCICGLLAGLVLTLSVGCSEEWPRPKHNKRRLTHIRQLLQYKTVLDGEIWFKTDDDLLFEESLPYFEEAGFSIEFKTYNLHEEKDIESFQTEHEKMFDEMGKTIKFLIARPSEQNKQI